MHLLFVCTGNTCRSPLAEGLARRIASTRGLYNVRVGSAGTGAWPDAAASDGAVAVAQAQGIDISRHRARLLTAELVASADLILTMSASHLASVEALGGAGRAWLLTAFVDPARARPIADPFGGDLETYRATFSDLELELTQLFDHVDVARARSGG